MKFKAPLTIMLLVLAGAVLLYAGVNLTVTIAMGTANIVCSGTSGANVTVPYSVSSQAAAAADGYYTLTQGTTTTNGSVPTITAGLTTDTPAGDWVKTSGPRKSYDNTLNLGFLSNGTYTVQICYEQPGVNGVGSGMFDCDQVTFQVDCGNGTPDTCKKVGVFGEFQGNKNLCQRGNKINFNFSGLADDPATVAVTGPSYYHEFIVPRDGASCNYHLQITPSDANMLTAGDYTFTVLGTSITDTETLSCTQH